MKTLVIVDMQKDFIDGSLANPAAQEIVPGIIELIKNWEGEIICTRDTHYDDYLLTQEGRNLPIKHCIKETDGWEVNDDIFSALVNFADDWITVDKNSFGDITELSREMDAYSDEIYLCGTCTDICVISVALNLKALYPETKIYCYGNLCAGLTPEKHEAALEVMRSCQIEVLNA